MTALLDTEYVSFNTTVALIWSTKKINNIKLILLSTQKVEKVARQSCKGLQPNLAQKLNKVQRIQKYRKKCSQ